MKTRLSILQLPLNAQDGFSFHHNYSVGQYQPAEGLAKRYYPSPFRHWFPASIESKPSDCPPFCKSRHETLALRIEPFECVPWNGLFACTEHSGEKDSGLFGAYSCPDPTQLCVIAGGATYIVDTVSGKLLANLGGLPISRVDVLLQEQMLILSTFFFICAWDVGGMRWETFELANYDLEIKSIGDGLIHGTGLKHDKSFTFQLDLKSGDYERDVRGLD
jgi:hypothetical protein